MNRKIGIRCNCRFEPMFRIGISGLDFQCLDNIFPMLFHLHAMYVTPSEVFPANSEAREAGFPGGFLPGMALVI